MPCARPVSYTHLLGIYDGYAYPWGFGVSPESGTTPDLTEPKRLVRELHDELGVDMVDLTMGNPYATTHVTRPFDFGKYEPDEHPLVGLARMIHGLSLIHIFCGREELLLYRERLRGYRKALSDSGLPEREEYLLRESGGSNGFYYQIRELAEQGQLPDAIFCTSDPKAFVVMHALQDVYKRQLRYGIHTGF